MSSRRPAFAIHAPLSARRRGAFSTWLLGLAGVLLAVGLSGCGYNNIQTTDEATKQAWAEVLNQYKRRADLIDNLVKTVRGYADHERDVLTQVTEARSRVGQVNVDPSDPAALKQFESAQAGMSSALSRLLVVSENYPQLKADQNFRELQAQLEGTENRITVERKRFNEVAQEYNTRLAKFPTNLFARILGWHFTARPYFAAQAGAATAPKVEF